MALCKKKTRWEIDGRVVILAKEGVGKDDIDVGDTSLLKDSLPEGGPTNDDEDMEEEMRSSFLGDSVLRNVTVE